MQPESGKARAELEAGEGELVDENGRETASATCRVLVMEDRNADQRQREQDEVDRNTKMNTGAAAKPLALVAAAAGEEIEVIGSGERRARHERTRALPQGARTHVRSATQEIPQHGVLRDNRRKGAAPSGFQSDIAACGCQRGPAWRKRCLIGITFKSSGRIRPACV